MSRKLFISCIAGLALSVLCPAPSLNAITFVVETVRGYSSLDHGFSIVNTQAENALSIGLTTPAGGGQSDQNVKVVLSDQALNHLHQYVYDLDATDKDLSIKECENGDYIWTCGVRDFSASVDVLVVRTTAAGNVIWAQVFGRNNNVADAGASIIETSTGEIMVTGTSEDPNGTGSKDAFVLNLNGSNGNTNWSFLYGTNRNDAARCIRELVNGNFIVVGDTEFNSVLGVDVQAWAFSINPMGVLQWSNHYGDVNTVDRFGAVMQHDNGYAYATGVHDAKNSFASNVFVAAIVPGNGAMSFGDAYIIGPPGDAIGWSIDHSIDRQRLVVSGIAPEFSMTGNTDGFFMLLSQALGIPNIYRQYGTPLADDVLRGIVPTGGQPPVNGPGYYMAGWTPVGADDSHWLIRTNTLGKTPCDAIQQPDPFPLTNFGSQPVVRKSFSQHYSVDLEFEVVHSHDDICTGQHVQDNAIKSGAEEPVNMEVTSGLGMSPNPAMQGQLVKISFTLDNAQEVELTVVDVQGRELLQTTYNAIAGFNEWLVPNSGWASGVYYLRLQVGDQVNSTQLMLVE